MGEIDKGDYEHTYLDEHWAMYRIIESSYHTVETNVTLQINYIWIKKGTSDWH